MPFALSVLWTPSQVEGSYKFGTFCWSVSFVRPFIGISLCSQQDHRYLYQLFSDFLLEAKESKKMTLTGFQKVPTNMEVAKSEAFGLLTKLYSIHT